MAGTIKTAAFLVMVMVAAVFAEDYEVGGDSKWTRPTTDPNMYSKWADGKTFRVGDVLEFEFPNRAHDVATVTKQAYDSCNKANPMNLILTSPVKITLNQTGPHYYICTIGDHCSAGQKLAINVTGATGGGSSGGGNTTNAPPPPNAASSLGGSATFLVALMSFALASFMLMMS